MAPAASRDRFCQRCPIGLSGWLAFLIVFLGLPFGVEAQDLFPAGAHRGVAQSEQTKPVETSKDLPEELQRRLDAASALPPEFSVYVRLTLAERLLRRNPTLALQEARRAFEEAPQARHAHGWEAVDAQSPAAESVEGQRPLALFIGLDALSLQARAVRVASRVNLDEALQWLPFVIRPEMREPGCDAFLLPTEAPRWRMLQTLSRMVWAFPPGEEAARGFRRQLWAAFGTEFAALGRISDLAPALSVVSEGFWSDEERAELVQLVAAAMKRIPALPRPALRVYQQVHSRVLAAPLGNDSGSAHLLRDAWAELLDRQLHVPRCEADGDGDAIALNRLRSLRDSGWEAKVGMGFRSGPLEVTMVSYGSTPRVWDHQNVEGFLVTPLWTDSEGVELHHALSRLLPSPKLRTPEVKLPDGRTRTIPLPREPQDAHDELSTTRSIAQVSERFARYRAAQDRHDLSAFHRIGLLWETFLRALRDGPDFAEELSAYGRYLEESSAFWEDPPGWLLRANGWFGIHQPARPGGVRLEHFPRLKALVDTDSLVPHRLRVPRELVPQQ